MEGALRTCGPRPQTPSLRRPRLPCASRPFPQQQSAARWPTRWLSGPPCGSGLRGAGNAPPSFFRCSRDTLPPPWNLHVWSWLSTRRRRLRRISRAAIDVSKRKAAAAALFPTPLPLLAPVTSCQWHPRHCCGDQVAHVLARRRLRSFLARRRSGGGGRC